MRKDKDSSARRRSRSETSPTGPGATAAVATDGEDIDVGAASVAEALCLELGRRGVEVVFGHPGGAILPLYDALHRARAPRHVLVRHEQAAAHAADGYARASGRVGVCMATSGPGATNLVTGLATAMMDGVPVIAITGQVPTTAMGTEAFQETDVFGVSMPVTKHAFIVDDPGRLDEILEEAFRIARSGRPGPVLLDLPKDVQTASIPGGWKACSAGSAEGPPPAGSCPAGNPVPAADAATVARLLDEATRPVIVAGRGVVDSDTVGTLLRLAEGSDVPVTTTLLGLDAFPASHRLALGMPGMHGTERANRAIQAADVVVGLGSRFDDRVIGRPGSFAPGATIVHFDIDAAAIGRTVPADWGVVGDLRETLPALAAAVAPRRRLAWQDRYRRWERWPEAGDRAAELTARQAARRIAELATSRQAVVVTDVGQHQMFMAQELRDAAPRTHLTSGGLGTMGYALPAAMGAALAGTGRPVWAVVGDGGFQMTMQELATVAELKLPLRLVILNNGFLGMVRQWQELFYERRYAETRLRGPDLVLLAAAYGLPGRTVEDLDELEVGLGWADDFPGPVLLDVRVPAEENVYPMVPAGAALDEMVGCPAKVAP